MTQTKYRRTKYDSPLHCPYCGKQFTMNGRYHDWYRDRNRGYVPMTTCFACGEEFYFRNLSAKYCREHNIKATRKRGEHGEAFVL